MEKVRTINYKDIQEHFQTKKEALALSEVTALPMILVERCEILLGDFITTHLESRDDAVYGAKVSWELLNAKLNSIRDDLSEATAMLIECHNYISEVREEEDKKEDVRC